MFSSTDVCYSRNVSLVSQRISYRTTKTIITCILSKCVKIIFVLLPNNLSENKSDFVFIKKLYRICIGLDLIKFFKHLLIVQR